MGDAFVTTLENRHNTGSIKNASGANTRRTRTCAQANIRLGTTTYISIATKLVMPNAHTDATSSTSSLQRASKAYTHADVGEYGDVDEYVSVSSTVTVYRT